MARNHEISIFFSTNSIVDLCHAPPSLQNRRDFLRKQRRKRGEREASAKREWRARGRALKNPACPHTIVQALPAFIYERGYPIGYLTSRDPRTFLKFNMAVSVDEAIRESLR